MKQHFNTAKWRNECALFADMPYHKDEKKAATQKRRELVALERRHKEHCESLYL